MMMMMILTKINRLLEKMEINVSMAKNDCEEEEDEEEKIDEIYDLYSVLQKKFKKCLKKNIILSK